jgi:hypothetical protein
VARRFERTVLGTVMSVIAFIIERRILKAIRATGREPVQPARRTAVGPGRKWPS